MSIAFEWAPVIVLGVLATFDLVARYLAFGRLESVAIDIAFVATAFNATQLVTFLVSMVGRDVGRLETLGLTTLLGRVAISALAAVGLMVTHTVLRRRAENIFNEVVKQLYNQITSAHDKKILEAVKGSLRRSVPLTFIGSSVTRSTKVRQGKYIWRKDVAEALDTVAAPRTRRSTTIAPVDPDSFLLPKGIRVTWLIGFGLFALVAATSTVVVIS